MDFLFGLDNLRRYRCCIDLTRNCLRIDGSNGPEEVPFLSEHELTGVDTNFNDPQADDMKISGETTSATTSNDSSSSSAMNNTAGASSSSSSATMDVETTSNSNSNSGNTTNAGAAAAPPSDRTEKIEQLIALGFARSDAEMALNQADGDVNLAATFLFAQQG